MTRIVLLGALLGCVAFGCSERAASTGASAAPAGGSAGASSGGSLGATNAGGSAGGSAAGAGGGGAAGGHLGGAAGANGGSAPDFGCPRQVRGDGDLSPAWVSYAMTPDAHSNLPSIAYAGYRHGEGALPELAGPVFDVTQYGAVADGVSDDTAAVRAALAAVPSSGGVVYFPDGVYALDGVLFVHTNQTVLRGQSRAGTKLVFRKPLATTYATNTNTNGQSRWSWSGGLVWFTPASKNTYRESVENVGATFDEDWNVGAELAVINGEALRGDRTIEVSDAGALVSGQYVFLQIDNTEDLSLVKHLTGDGEWAESYDWSPANSGRILPASRPKLMWPVLIDAVSGNTVTLHQPLRFDLRAGFNARLHAVGDVIRESGIERLSISFAREYTWNFAEYHNQEVGWNGPWFNNAIDCFLREVTVENAENGPGVSAAKNVTLTDFSLTATSEALSAHHHGTTMRVFSQDILFEKFVIESRPFHGVNVEGFSMGGVWSEAQMLHGTFDTHRNLPLDCVHTEISIDNDGQRGGAADAGPIMGARFVNWNIDVTGGDNEMIGSAAIMPLGAVVGVRGAAIDVAGNSGCLVEGTGTTPNPPNLYQAALALRLCGGI